MPRLVTGLAAALVLVTAAAAMPLAAKQPRVAPGPSEPDWIAILDSMYGLRMFEDLENPVGLPPRNWST